MDYGLCLYVYQALLVLCNTTDCIPGVFTVLPACVLPSV